MDTKKILLISRVFIIPGAFEQFKLLEKYRDVKIYMIVPKKFDEVLFRNEFDKRQRNVHISNLLYLKKNSSFTLYYPFLKYLLKVRPDIIYLEEEPWLLSAFQIILLCKILLPKAKIIQFTWENIYRKRIFPINFFEWFNIKNSDAFVAGNSEAKNVLIKKGVKKPISLISQWGVNTKRFVKNINEEKKGLDPNGKVIGFVGRVTKSKGILTLVETLSKLPKSYSLLIIGDGDLIEEIRGKNSIRIVSVVPYFSMPKYFNLMDLLVLPSESTIKWKEQFGHVLIEAMSCGVPVIGSNSGAIPEVIGDAGLIFKEGNIEDLKEKILMLEDKKLRRDLIRKGKSRVEESFTIESVSKKFHDLFFRI